MKPIRILYDSCGLGGRYSGVSKYFRELMIHLPDGYAWELGFLNTRNCNFLQPPFDIPFSECLLEDFVKAYLGGQYRSGAKYLYGILATIFKDKFPSGELCNRKFLQDKLKRCDFDVYHPTAAHYIKADWRLVATKKPIVITVHDVIPEKLNSDMRIRRNRQMMLKVASQVIAISENTKQDILSMYDVDERKISVVRHGYSGMSGEMEPTEGLSLPFENFVLYVGKRAGYKNFNFFVEAIAPVLIKFNLNLVCTGDAFTTKERRLIQQCGISDRVHCSYFTERQLHVLYSRALAFVYPSLYEGFGLPILDAFQAGCPVILSRCSCFPEIGGDAALYFDVGDKLGLQNHIARLVNAPDFRSKQAERGRKRVLSFTWNRCGEETAIVYLKAVEEFKRRCCL